MHSSLVKNTVLTMHTTLLGFLDFPTVVYVHILFGNPIFGMHTIIRFIHIVFRILFLTNLTTQQQMYINCIISRATIAWLQTRKIMI